MDYSFFDLLRLLGALGLFLYGMKIMSEGLQKLAGDSLRRILTAMTSNRVAGVLTGMLITALIQSSSATTVMVVGFVNAGIMNGLDYLGVGFQGGYIRFRVALPGICLPAILLRKELPQVDRRVYIRFLVPVYGA